MQTMKMKKNAKQNPPEPEEQVMCI